MENSKKFNLLHLAAAVLFVLLGLTASFFFHWKSAPKKIDLSFQTLEGTSFSLDEIPSNQKAVVLFVQGNGCPIVRKSLRSFENLRKKYPEGAKVSFYLVNSNPQDTLEDVRQELKEYGVEARTLKDPKQEFIKKMGVTRTAHLLIMERDSWKLRYSGALDQSLHYEGSRGGADLNLPEKILEDVLAGRSGDVETSEVKGCLIGNL